MSKKKNKTRKVFQAGEIELMEILSQTTLSPDDITEQVNQVFGNERKTVSVLKRMKDDGMIYSVSDVQRDIEDNNHAIIEEYWGSLGYYTEMKWNNQGETRSNMKNGLPNSVASPKEYWINHGFDRYKKVILQRRQDGTRRKRNP